MKVVVADTSALISLAMSGQLALAVKSVSFLVPPRVRQELREISGYRDREGRAAKRVLKLVSLGTIQLKVLKGRRRANLLVDKSVDLGEAECLVLAEEQNTKTILMDDIRAAYSLHSPAKAQGISLRISAAVVVELVKTGKLTKKKAVHALTQMIQRREWEKGVLEHLVSRYLKRM